MRKIDMIGRAFSRLTVYASAGSDKDGLLLYNTICSCGNRQIVLGKLLRNSHTQSCGCLHKELLGKRNKEQSRHGMTNTLTHKSWTAMLQRCNNPNSADFKNYKSKCCAEWFVFENFFEYMGERPKGTTLGRILDRGNYEPGNAFWQTTEEQNLSKRNNHALLTWEAQCT